MINRREFLGTSLTVGAGLALTPELLFSQQPGTLMQRAIPSSGEMLPVVSFGAERRDTSAMKDILKTLVDHGGRVVDGVHGGGEQDARTAAIDLGIQDRFFWTTSLNVVGLTVGPVLPGVRRKPDPVATRVALEKTLATFKVSTVNAVMVGTASFDPAPLFPALREMKKDGRVRYIGVHHLANPPNGPYPPFDALESIIRNEPIDFVATDYSMADRRAEELILPLAMERKIAFMSYFTFDRGRLFTRVGSTPLPEWAAEFDAKTWAQFFIKYVLSHPAVTVARTGTTKAAHMLDNIGGGGGRLPNEAMRKRMAQFVDALPQTAKPPAPSQSQGRTMLTPEQVQQQQSHLAPTVALSSAILDRYVGEYTHVEEGTMVTIRRDGERLLVNVHGSTLEETPFVARTETRFAAATIFALEFQVDGQGTVTGATWEQGPQRIPLVRM